MQCDLVRPVSSTMSSLKVFFCDICVILIVGVLVLNALAEDTDISPSADDGPNGNCTCAGFRRPSNVVGANSEPLISQNPGLEVKCDDDGENTCKQLCIALATAAKAKGPEVLCQRLKDAEELKLSAFSKICERPWIYADMTAEEPLCCADAKVKVCASAEKKINSTDTVDAKTML